MSVVTEGILNMPFDMAMADELSRRQFYQTVRDEIRRLGSLEAARPFMPAGEPVADRDVEALRQFAREATQAITGLTVGGSEFFGKRVGDIYLADLPYCVRHIRGRMEDANERAVKALRDLRHWKEEVGKLRAHPVVAPGAEPVAAGEDDMPARIWAGDFDAQGFGHCVAGMQGGLYAEYVRADLAHPGVEALREALTWYADKVAGCRRLGNDGHDARTALDADGGKRAREALAALSQPNTEQEAPVAVKATPDEIFKILSEYVERYPTSFKDHLGYLARKLASHPAPEQQPMGDANWKRIDRDGSILIYTLRQNGWRKGEPVMVNDVTVHVEAANGSETPIRPIADAILATLASSPTPAAGMVAEQVVDALFEDLRDRRFLKWLFSEHPTLIGKLEGEPLHSLDADVQQEIRTTWTGLVSAALASPAVQNREAGQ